MRFHSGITGVLRSGPSNLFLHASFLAYRVVQSAMTAPLAAFVRAFLVDPLVALWAGPTIGLFAAPTAPPTTTSASPAQALPSPSKKGSECRVGRGQRMVSDPLAPWLLGLVDRAADEVRRRCVEVCFDPQRARSQGVHRARLILPVVCGGVCTSGHSAGNGGCHRLCPA